MRKQVSPVLIDNLIRLAKAYNKAISETAKTDPARSSELRKYEKGSMRSISRQAHGDPPFFDNLIAGKGGVTLRKYDEVVAWFDDKADWPPGYTRPKLNDPKHGPRVPLNDEATTKPKKAKNDVKKGNTGKRKQKTVAV